MPNQLVPQPAGAGDPSPLPTPTPAPAPAPQSDVQSKVLKWLKWAGVAVAVAGWVVGAYHALKKGEPLPPLPPDVFVAPVDPVPVPDPAVHRPYGWTRPTEAEVPDKVWSVPPTVNENDLPASHHLLQAPASGVPAPLPFDQGQLGACGPNSASALILYAEMKAGKTGLPPPSRLFVYYATRTLMGTVGQDSGVSNATMFRALKTYGFPDESQWPYQVSQYRVKPSQSAYNQALGRKVVTAEAVPQVLSTMKACLASGKPFVFGFDVYPSFESQAVAKSGQVPMPGRTEQSIGGHDVLVTGYDDSSQRFTFLNSWGPTWGQKGFGTIPYAYATNKSLAGDFWTMGDSPRTKPAVPDVPDVLTLPIRVDDAIDALKKAGYSVTKP